MQFKTPQVIIRLNKGRTEHHMVRSSHTSIIAKLTALSTLCLSFPLPAANTSARLTLAVGGTITTSPVWQDASGSVITTVHFNFTGKVTGKKSANIDSALTTIKLVHVTAYPANVALVRPAGCTIGSSTVDDKHVHFLNNDATVTRDSNISIPNRSLQSYGLRFSAAGHYGDLPGEVACSRSGSLTYTY